MDDLTIGQGFEVSVRLDSGAMKELETTGEQETTTMEQRSPLQNKRPWRRRQNRPPQQSQRPPWRRKRSPQQRKRPQCCWQIRAPQQRNRPPQWNRQGWDISWFFFFFFEHTIPPSPHSQPDQRMIWCRPRWCSYLAESPWVPLLHSLLVRPSVKFGELRNVKSAESNFRFNVKITLKITKVQQNTGTKNHRTEQSKVKQARQNEYKWNKTKQTTETTRSDTN